MDGSAAVVQFEEVAAARELERLEDRVRLGIRGSFDAGAALKEIREKGLYRLRDDGRHQTFEAYCLSVWCLSARHVSRLIDGHETFVAVTQTGPTGPVSAIVMTERLLRPLASLSAVCDKVAAFAAAVKLAEAEGKQVTARHVAIAVLDLKASADPNRAFSSTIKPTDNWNFSPVRYPRQDGEEGHGYIPGDLYANCLWFWTRPGQTVAAPMAGAGQIWNVYTRRAEWGIPEPWNLDLRLFDLNPRGPYAHLITSNDLTEGLPVERAHYIVMDVPYFGMVEQQYSSKSQDIANMKIEGWSSAMAAVARSCRAAQELGDLCTVISPNFRELKTGEVILTTVVVREVFAAAGYRLHDLAYSSRRIQQDQSPRMGINNNLAKRNRVMMTDISEVMTFRAVG